MCFPGGGTSNYPPLTGLKLADLNGDGKLDIVAGMGNGSSTTSPVLAVVLMNPGQASWGTANLLKLTSGTSQSLLLAGLAVGNFTADTKLDILVGVVPPSGQTSTLTGLYLLTGDGAGGFTVGTASTLVDGCTAHLLVGDFDEDTKLDVALVDQNGTKITLAFGGGDGTFGSPVSAPLTAIPGNGNGGFGGVCPQQNSLGTAGLGSYLMAGVGHYTGSTHWDVALGQSIIVSNGRSAPKQTNIVSSGNRTGAPSTGGNDGLPVADLDGNGTADLIQNQYTPVYLINPTGYHSW